MVAPSTSQALRYDSTEPIQERIKQRSFTSHASRDNKAGPAPTKMAPVSPRQSGQDIEELDTAENFKKIGSDNTCKGINGDSCAPPSSNSHGRPGAAPHAQEACLLDEAVANHNGDVDARAGSPSAPSPAPQTGLVRADRQTVLTPHPSLTRIPPPFHPQQPTWDAPMFRTSVRAIRTSSSLSLPPSPVRRKSKRQSCHYEASLLEAPWPP
jgi:hypothetical protein